MEKLVSELEKVQQAEERAARIRGHIEEAAREYAQAIIEEDWKTLGCTTVQDWADQYLGIARFKPEARKEVEDLLLAAGFTFRQTANAIGVSAGTVASDQKNSVQKLNTGTKTQKAARRRESAKRAKPVCSREGLFEYVVDRRQYMVNDDGSRGELITETKNVSLGYTCPSCGGQFDNGKDAATHENRV